MTHFPIVFLNGYGDVMQPQIPKPALFLFIILPHPHLGGVIFLSRALRAPTTTPKPRDISPKMTHFPTFLNGKSNVMQPQISTPAKFVFILLTHPCQEGVISPSRALGAASTAPKQPALSGDGCWILKIISLMIREDF